MAGADAFISTPVQGDVLSAQLHCASRIIELQDRMKSRNDFLEFSYASVTTDLKIAAKVQEDLLPRQFRLAGLDTSWVFKPANYVTISHWVMIILFSTFSMLKVMELLQH